MHYNKMAFDHRQAADQFKNLTMSFMELCIYTGQYQAPVIAIEKQQETGIHNSNCLHLNDHLRWCCDLDDE
jgi:hypothetical protein